MHVWLHLNACFHWLLKIRNWKQSFTCFQFPSQIKFWKRFLFSTHFELPNKFFSLKNRKLFLKTENKEKKQLPNILLVFSTTRTKVSAPKLIYSKNFIWNSTCPKVTWILFDWLLLLLICKMNISTQKKKMYEENNWYI